MTKEQETSFTQPILDKIAEALPDGVTDAEILSLMMSIMQFYQIPHAQAKAMFKVGVDVYEAMEDQSGE